MSENERRYWIKELKRATVGKCEIVLYRRADGSDLNDPATEVQERICIFLGDPGSIQDKYDNLHKYRDELNERDDADLLADERVEYVQHADREAVDAKREEAFAEGTAEVSSWYRRSSVIPGFSEFLAAIDVLADESGEAQHEAAWQTVNEYLNAPRRQHEKDR